MAFSFRNDEQALINRLRHQHDQGTVYALGTHQIVPDAPDNPAYVAMILTPSGDDHAEQYAQAWTAPATQWVALAHEVLRTLVPSSASDQLEAINEGLGELSALIEGLPDQLAGH